MNLTTNIPPMSRKPKKKERKEEVKVKKEDISDHERHPMTRKRDTAEGISTGGSFNNNNTPF